MSGRASGRSDLHGSSPQIHLIGDHASSPTLKRSSTDAKLRNSPDNTGRPQSGLGLPRSGSTVIAGQPSQKPRTLRESALAGGGSKEFSRKGTNGSLQNVSTYLPKQPSPLSSASTNDALDQRRSLPLHLADDNDEVSQKLAATADVRSLVEEDAKYMDRELSKIIADLESPKGSLSDLKIIDDDDFPPFDMSFTRTAPVDSSSAARRTSVGASGANIGGAERIVAGPNGAAPIKYPSSVEKSFGAKPTLNTQKMRKGAWVSVKDFEVVRRSAEELLEQNDYLNGEVMRLKEQIQSRETSERDSVTIAATLTKENQEIVEKMRGMEGDLALARERIKTQKDTYEMMARKLKAEAAELRASNNELEALVVALREEVYRRSAKRNKSGMNQSNEVEDLRRTNAELDGKVAWLRQRLDGYEQESALREQATAAAANAGVSPVNAARLTKHKRRWSVSKKSAEDGMVDEEKASNAGDTPTENASDVGAHPDDPAVRTSLRPPSPIAEEVPRSPRSPRSPRGPQPVSPFQSQTQTHQHAHGTSPSSQPSPGVTSANNPLSPKGQNAFVGASQQQQQQQSSVQRRRSSNGPNLRVGTSDEVAAPTVASHQQVAMLSLRDLMYGTAGTNLDDALLAMHRGIQAQIDGLENSLGLILYRLSTSYERAIDEWEGVAEIALMMGSTSVEKIEVQVMKRENGNLLGQLRSLFREMRTRVEDLSMANIRLEQVLKATMNSRSHAAAAAATSQASSGGGGSALTIQPTLSVASNYSVGGAGADIPLFDFTGGALSSSHGVGAGGSEGSGGRRSFGENRAFEAGFNSASAMAASGASSGSSVGAGSAGMGQQQQQQQQQQQLQQQQLQQQQHADQPALAQWRWLDCSYGEILRLANKRNSLIANMRHFEKTMADPRRLSRERLAKGSMHLIDEERFRRTAVPELLKIERKLRVMILQFEHLTGQPFYKDGEDYLKAMEADIRSRSFEMWM